MLTARGQDRPTASIRIGSKTLTPGHKTFIVAEIGGNHGGNPELAQRMVQAAAECGVDAVKFQAYRTSEFLSPLSPYFDELAAEELTFEVLSQLVAQAHDLGICAGLTVFDSPGLDLADGCGADFIKISSGDINHPKLISSAALTGKPLIISTGASNESEVRAALEYSRPAQDRLILLQCASLYPAPADSANLAVMRAWLDEGLAAGYSDHVLGLSAALAAIGLGAVVVEKHFTTDQSLPGGDNSISADPIEMSSLVTEAHNLFKKTADKEAIDRILLGNATKQVYLLEEPVRALIRRAVTAATDLKAGHRLSSADLTLLRPPQAGEDFFSPEALPELVNQVLQKDLKAGSPFTRGDLKEKAHG